MNDFSKILIQIKHVEKNIDTISTILKDKLFKKQFKDFEDNYKTFKSYLLSYSNIFSGMVAMPQKRVNPYLAGSIANSIAGPGAGIYAATNAANHNAKVDDAYQKMATANINEQILKNNIVNSFILVRDIISSVPETEQFILAANEEIKEKEDAEKRTTKQHQQKTKHNNKFITRFIIIPCCILFIIAFIFMIYTEVTY